MVKSVLTLRLAIRSKQISKLCCRHRFTVNFNYAVSLSINWIPILNKSN